MIVYATVPDLQAWVPSSVTVPDDAPQLLRSASIIVARAVNESPYADGVTTTPAKRDATCAQVAAWLATDIRPGTGGLQSTPVVRSKAVDTAKVEYDTSLAASVTAFQMRERVAQELAPEARAILQAAGLLWLPVALASSSGGECVAEGAEWPYRAVPADWWRG